LLVGAKHLEDKLSVIAKNSSPNASPVQLLVGAKHLEDKLSVIAKNSSPNASPVQLSVVNFLRENDDDDNVLSNILLHPSNLAIFSAKQTDVDRLHRFFLVNQI
jgi:hypothetical protein